MAMNLGTAHPVAKKKHRCESCGGAVARVPGKEWREDQWVTWETTSTTFANPAARDGPNWASAARAALSAHEAKEACK